MTHRFVPVPLAPFALAAFVLGVAGPARAATLPVEPEAATADLTATVHAVKADADELEVVSGTGHALRVYTLRVGPGCQIRLEGESATLADLEPGQIVRVHYRDADGARVAMTIDAPPAPAAGGRR